jgi:murein L,D-transpeptidase YafK
MHRLICVLAAALLHTGSLARSAPLPPDDCAQQRPAPLVVINTQAHRLSLCRDRKAEQTFAVSLGHNGVGKRAEGDNRTPLGFYALGAPRPSAEFVLFIPVGYPTAEQRREGFTGGDIGIHGPKKTWSWAGRLANLIDWTRGCIAVNRSEDIQAIAAWVTRHQPTHVALYHPRLHPLVVHRPL